MKLGMLNAVPSASLLDGQTDPDKFAQLFRSVGVAVEMSIYETTRGELPDSVEGCDAFLITGSPYNVYDNLPWIAGLEQFIQRCYAQRKKLVGICFGHQLIAQALGGQVQEAEAGWLLGLHQIHIEKQQPWLWPLQQRCSLYFVNHDQVVTLPPRAELIGGNERCPYTIYTIEEQVLCIQAHPEQPEIFLRAIIRYLTPQLTTAMQHDALASLDQGQPDAETVAQWLVNFITKKKIIN